MLSSGDKAAAHLQFVLNQRPADADILRLQAREPGVHGNRIALDAVIEDARSFGVDVFCAVGDLAAIGPEPVLVLEALADDHVVVAPEWPGYGAQETETQLFDMLDFTLHGLDLVDALVDWVERGIEPDSVTAWVDPDNSEVPEDWSPERTRPLCAYPSVPVYQGGDVEDASSFKCE